MGNKTLVIDRAKWRTGDDSDIKTGEGETELINRQGYMCCLGFRCIQAGMPEEIVKDHGEPVNVDRRFYNLIPELVNTRKQNTLLAGKLMVINDNETLPIKEKESEVKRLFATKGIKVKFIGNYK